MNEVVPASMVFLAATLKSLTISGISSVPKRLGGVNCLVAALSMPLLCSVSGLFVEEIGAWPFG